MALKKIARVMVCLLLVVGLSYATTSRAEAATSRELLTQIGASLTSLQQILMSWGFGIGLTPEASQESLTAAAVSASTTTAVAPGYLSVPATAFVYDPKTELAIPDLADIDVYKASDTNFYITGTAIQHTDQIKLYQSSDLITFTLVAVLNPSVASTTADFCHIWAPDLSYVNNQFVMTFSAQIRAEKQPCEAPVDTTTGQPTLYEIHGSDIYHFGTPTPVHYGTVVSGYGKKQTAPKIDPERYGNRLYYVWFTGGNNISSVSTVAPYGVLLHTKGSQWKEGGINEAPQLFTRNGLLYMQFSAYNLTTGYTTNYMKGTSYLDLVRTASNTKALAVPIVTPGCDLATSTCVLENYGHGAVFAKGNQYYYFHHRMWPSTGSALRKSFLTPIYFKANGDLVSMTTTRLSWNQLGADYQYMLDILPTGTSTWTQSCVSAAKIGATTSVTFNGLCPSVSTSTIIRKHDVAAFRICYTRDGMWGSYHSKCVEVANDVTQDELQLALPPLPDPLKTTVSWNQLGGDYLYSLDIKTNKGVWVGPCTSANIIKNGTSYTYTGACQNASGTVVAKADITYFKIVYTRDSMWGAGHATSTLVVNDLTKDVLTTTLAPLPDPYKTTLSWNQLGSNYQYSLDVSTSTSSWIAPCMGAVIIMNATTYTYTGVCQNKAKNVVPKATVATFRLCYSRDGLWTYGHAKCVVVKNDLTKDLLTFPNLVPIP